MKSTPELIKQALDTWGVEAQLDMVVEECAELIDAVCKWRRRRIESSKVLEEGVDVELMIEQLKHMLDAPNLWEQVREQKLKRLSERLVNLVDSK